jgi:hypothetical protein
MQEQSEGGEDISPIGHIGPIGPIRGEREAKHLNFFRLSRPLFSGRARNRISRRKALAWIQGALHRAVRVSPAAPRPVL